VIGRTVSHSGAGAYIASIDLGRTKNGYDFLKEAKSLPVTVSSLVHSNRVTDDAMAKAYNLGALGFMGKPLILEDMVRFFDDPQNFRRKTAFPSLKSREVSTELNSELTPKSPPSILVSSAKTPSRKKGNPLNLAILTTRKIDGQYIEMTVRDALDPVDGKLIETRSFTEPEQLVLALTQFKPQVVISDALFETFRLADSEQLFFQIKKISPASAIFCLNKNGSEPPSNQHIDGWFNPLHDSEEIGKTLEPCLRLLGGHSA